MHNEFRACFSLYVYAEALDKADDRYRKEFQQASSWLRFNFHTRNDKKYGETSVIDDYDQCIKRLLTMVGGDVECLDSQYRANYWQMSESNGTFLVTNRVHKSYIFCAKDAFSPSPDNYYLSPEQQKLVFANGIYFDIQHRAIFIHTCKT